MMELRKVWLLNDLNISADELNTNACDMICHLIRLLGLGGKILIDFLPSNKSTKKKILDKMINFSKMDEAKSKVWGWTKGGNFELERERDKTPLNFIFGNN